MTPEAAGFRADADGLKRLAPGLLRAAGSRGYWADLFLEQTVRQDVLLEQHARSGRIDPPRLRSGQGVLRGSGLRVCSEDGVFYAATEDVSGPGLSSLPNRLMRPEPDPDPAAGWDRRTGVGEETGYLHCLARDAAAAAFSLDEHVRKVTVSAHAVVRDTSVALPDGTAHEQRAERIELRIAVSFSGPQGIVEAYAVGGQVGDGRRIVEPWPENVAREAVERARVLGRAQPLSGGEMPVVLAPGWGGVWLHECAGHLFEADVAGPRVAAAPPGVTLVDDATLPGGRGSYEWDDEGSAARRVVLMEDGEPRGRLTDRVRAERLGLPLTGSGRRQDYRFPPLPRMSNFYLLPGPSDPDDLIGDVNDGLYVSTIGGGTVYPDEDRYTFDVVEGYRIEAGRITHPVTSVRIEGRLSGALEQIAGIGNDLAFDHARGMCVKHGQAVPVSVGMPTVLLRRLHVSPSPPM